VRSLLAIGAIVVSAGLTYGRLYYGVDFTDEAFYIAVPYRLVLGAHPLVDETNIVQQTPAVLLYPFVALWHWLVGLDGLVLYARHLHFLFTVGVAIAVFASLRRLLDDTFSSAVYATAAIVFVPFGIHGLSYNTFASGFFTAGCFLGAAWAADRQPGLLVAAGSAHALAIFTYPTFVLPVACFFAALYTVRRSLRALWPGFLPAAIGTFATGVFFVHQGVGTIDDLVQQTSDFGDQGGDLGELGDIFSFVWSSFTYKYAAAALLIAAIFARLWKPWATPVPLLLVPFAALPADLRTSATATGFVTSFALLAPFVFLLIRNSDLGKRLLLCVWLPAAVAGLTTAISSANGPIAVAIGFFPALIVTAVMIGLVLRRVSAADFAPAVVLLAVGVAIQYLSVYRDDGITNLTTPVGDGAYAGILTTSAKRDYLRTLGRDLAAASGPECRIVFYDTFPAGYLLGHGRPATNATWLLEVADDDETRYQQLLLDYYDEHGGLPDVAVRVDRIPLTASDASIQAYAEQEPLERVFAGPGYENAAVSEDYRITRARRSACRQS
jgi:hypothetical protein